jgi:hypothetical protein
MIPARVIIFVPEFSAYVVGALEFPYCESSGAAACARSAPQRIRECGKKTSCFDLVFLFISGYTEYHLLRDDLGR